MPGDNPQTAEWRGEAKSLVSLLGRQMGFEGGQDNKKLWGYSSSPREDGATERKNSAIGIGFKRKSLDAEKD